MAEFASKGVAGSGLGLGIAGTALGILNSGFLNGGCGLFGGWNGECANGINSPVSNAEKLSALEAMLAREKAERYTDQKILGSVKEIFDEFRAGDAKLAGVVKDTTSALIEVGTALTRVDKEVECLKTAMAKDQEINSLKLENLKSELSGAIALESERRACGDQNLYNYVNATFVPGKLVMPLSSICPPAKPACETTTPTTGA